MTDRSKHIYDAERSIEAYHEYQELSDQIVFKTGIDMIDTSIKGLGPGEVLTIIARSGVWKTTLAQKFVYEYLKSSPLLVLFFSIEMPVPNIVYRYRKAAHDPNKQPDDHYREVFQNLVIVDAKVSTEDIFHYTKEIEMERDVEVGLICIDYLGLMDGFGKDDYQRVSHIARDIKVLAKGLNVPIILVAQCSRKAGDGTIELSLDMIRDSGAIEESADFVLGLWKEEQQTLSTEWVPDPEWKVICKILKNRKGPAGATFVLELDASNYRIGNKAEVWQRPKRNWGNY
jgi:replicative DNA helicase